MKLLAIIAAISVVVSHASADEVYLSANGGSCSGAFELNDWEMVCGGDQYCATGDAVDTEVEAELKSDLSSDSLCADLHASITVVGLSVHTRTITNNKQVTLCDYTDDCNSSPAAGTYDFDIGGITIPPFTPANWMNLVGGRSNLILYESDCTTQIASCTFRIRTSSSGGSTSMIVGTSFAMVSLLGAALFVRRRRRTVKTESDENGHGFELMGETQHQKSGVAV